MIRGKMAIMIDPMKMMPGNQPQDLQALIKAKKEREEEGDAGISGPLNVAPPNFPPSPASNLGNGDNNGFNQNDDTQEGGNADPSLNPEQGGMKHIKRAKVTGRKNKKIPTFHQDAGEKRSMVLSEIRKSEQMYVMVLDSFVQVFIRPLLADPGNYKLKQDQAEQLCSSFQKVSKFAAEFSKSPAFAVGEDISEAFITSIDQLTEVYNAYVETFLQNILHNFHNFRTNIRFAAFLRQLQERHSIQVIDTFLIPLQRMAVYELLLRKLLQNYTADMAEYKKIQDTIELIRNSSEKCSQIREEAEESAKVLSEQMILSRNGRDITLWSPERRLIRKATLIKAKRKDVSDASNHDTRGENHRHVLLFTDLLLWATEAPDSSYKGHLFLTEASFKPLQEGDVASILVCILSESEQKKNRKRHEASEADDKKYSKGDGWLLTFSDSKDRDSWLTDINKMKDKLAELPDDTELMVPLNIRSDKAKSCCTIM